MNPNEQPHPVPFLEWDTHEVIQQQAQFLVETGAARDEDEGFAMACGDSDLVTWAWESLTECLTETLQALNPEGYWHVEVSHFGWRGQSGCADFEADSGQRFLGKILPKTDCAFRLFLDEDKTIRIQNFHHDAPTGNEWYTVHVVAQPNTEAA